VTRIIEDSLGTAVSQDDNDTFDDEGWLEDAGTRRLPMEALW